MIIKILRLTKSITTFLVFGFCVTGVANGTTDLSPDDKVAEFDRVAATRNIRTTNAVNDELRAAQIRLFKRIEAGEDLDASAAQQAIVANMLMPADMEGEAMRIIDADPSDDLALEAINVVLLAHMLARDENSKTKEFITDTPGGKVHTRMAQLALKYHLNRPEVLDLYLKLSDEAEVNYWREVYQSSSNRDVRGNAAMKLVDYYLYQSSPLGIDSAKRRSFHDQAKFFAEAVRRDYADVMPCLMVGVPRSMHSGKRADYRGPETPRLGALVDNRMNLLASSAGNMSPNLKVVNLKGEMDEMANYRGKVVLIDFWAIWCAYCIEQHPHLEALKKKMAGRPFEVIAVSVDDDPEDALDYVEDKAYLNWVQWWAGPEGGILDQLSIQAFPTYILIDADGMIQARGGTALIGDDFDAYVDELVTRAEASE